MKKLIALICAMNVLPMSAFAANEQMPYTLEEMKEAMDQKGQVQKRELDLRAFTPGERRKLIKLADQGNANAAYIVGIMFEQGDGTGKDIEKAKTYYKKAEKEIVAATYRLGKIEPDEKKQSAYYKKAADKGYLLAMTAYGKSIDTKNPKTAGQYFEMACNPEADYDPEACYLRGLAFEKNSERKTAYRYFKKSAENMYIPGVEKYGDYLLEEMDYKRAFRLYQTAATFYLIGEDQQRLLDKRNEAGKHLLEEEKREIILDISK